ncbi:MAG: hypothetical protein LBC09_01990 [Helicobacteraceae bacterium]|jgi:hypothetical protein|nr:hypothetical protein [Helicobacteraceae bacterium]
MSHKKTERDEALLQQALSRFNDEGAIKVLTTLDENGAPHPVCKGSLRFNGETIESWEILESSETNRNLTRSIWFDKPIAILLITPDKKAYKFSVKASRNIIAGKEFTSAYEAAQARYKGRGIAGVWRYEIISVKDETASTRISEEAAARPYFVHLDQLAKRDNL